MPRDTLNKHLEKKYTSNDSGIITIPKSEISTINNHNFRPYKEVKFVFKKEEYNAVELNFFEYFKIDTPKELKKRYKAILYLNKE